GNTIINGNPSVGGFSGIFDFDNDSTNEVLYARNGWVYYRENGGTEVNTSVPSYNGEISGFGRWDSDRYMEFAVVDSNENVYIGDTNGEIIQTSVDAYQILDIGDADGNGDLKKWGKYNSTFYNASEEKIWFNATVDVSQPGSSDVNVTVTSYNSGSVVESTTITSLTDGKHN
ncbi:MAG: hypothetical protein SVU32_09245, partial [Candidatus Nanohaloarchaea archaeon]|nr:hypothetical protein [Candidatus Nanohaloarchaea archaeon]